MKIDRIKISNFKSIGELDLNFQEMNGLWEISGVVGAGKTTIGEAILFALFGNIRGKTNESLITWGKKHSLVEAWIYTKNRHLHIRREINSYGQSPLLVDVDGEEVLGSDKRSIQGILESEWYDVSRQTLELLCVISFNNFKSLSTLNTADSREFLNSTVAFDKIDIYEEYCKTQVRELNTKIYEYEKDLQSYRGATKALDDAMPEKPKYESVTIVDDRIHQEQSVFDDMEREYRTARQVLESMVNTKTDNLRATTSSLKQLQSTYKQLRSGVCPLCGGAVTPEHRQGLENDIKTTQTSMEHTKVLAEEARDKLDAFDKENQEKIAGQKKVLDELHAERLKTSMYEEQLKKLSDKRKDYEHSISVFANAISGLQVQVEDWQALLDFIRTTVRPAIISSLIPNINKYIQLYMSRIHQNYVVFFDDDFRCMMKNPFGEPIPVYSLSTGQKKVIDMVIILAFIKTFITQIDFNVYFMDELIGNIDADLRDEMCGLLRDTLDDKDVMFLISHSPINQEYLDGVIKVTRIAGISEYDIINISK